MKGCIFSNFLIKELLLLGLTPNSLRMLKILLILLCEYEKKYNDRVAQFILRAFK